MNIAATIMLRELLAERLAREKQYLTYETDQDTRNRRVKYIAALEKRVAQLSKQTGGKRL